jgi:hypothetical protein
MSFTVGVETLNALAKALVERLRGSRYSSLIISPGWTGRISFLVITHIVSGTDNKYSALNDGTHSKHQAPNFVQIKKPPQPKLERFPPGQSLLRIIPAVPQKLV